MACMAGVARSASRPAPPVTGSRSPAATRAPASPRPTWGACSNPFSPPAWATTRGWACTSCTTSPPMCWAARSRPPAAAATPASCCAAPARLPCCPPFLYPPAPLPEGPVHEHPAPPAPVLPPVPADRDLRGRFSRLWQLVLPHPRPAQGQWPHVRRDRGLEGRDRGRPAAAPVHHRVLSDLPANGGAGHGRDQAGGAGSAAGPTARAACGAPALLGAAPRPGADAPAAGGGRSRRHFLRAG